MCVHVVTMVPMVNVPLTVVDVDTWDLMAAAFAVKGTQTMSETARMGRNRTKRERIMWYLLMM
jgi:hypothetical protein